MDILISFNNADGNWSYIGTDSLYFTQPVQQAPPAPAAATPSMNLGDCTVAMLVGNNPHFVSTALHEFGHALGLQHETQSTDKGGIQVDMKKANKYYFEKYGFTPEMVKVNIGALDYPKQLRVTPFDKLSIMTYYIPIRLQAGAKRNPVLQNFVLSAGDLANMRKLYA